MLLKARKLIESEGEKVTFNGEKGEWKTMNGAHIFVKDSDGRIHPDTDPRDEKDKKDVDKKDVEKKVADEKDVVTKAEGISAEDKSSLSRIVGVRDNMITPEYIRKASEPWDPPGLWKNAGDRLSSVKEAMPYLKKLKVFDHKDVFKKGVDSPMTKPFKKDMPEWFLMNANGELGVMYSKDGKSLDKVIRLDKYHTKNIVG